MFDYEKLGVFYLGRESDPASGALKPGPLLYDSRDLTTHAVIIGMTGSGKTGLGITLLEEAAIDSIPAIVIDPKGDMGNLLLAFPDLKPSDFRPWIASDRAASQGLDPDDFAAATAEAWRQGLADWDQQPDRIGRFRDAADVVIYTPGSDAGLPLSILKSLDAPSPEVRASADSLRERVTSTASGLLALLGIPADPLRSREHILLSTIFDKAWAQGRHLSLTDLIREIQTPPFRTLGVLDLDQFFPLNERMSLALAVNSIIAAPAFAAWSQGEPLNIQRLLYSETGRPRVSILSIAHLSENERSFFVTILLNELISWMRSQPGTSSLRALFYMDEVFGYFPPTANPPTKVPMRSVLKQARAYGLGMVLSTQNPVDLDYKALSNAGTWFLGRLQTERDQDRVMDGLQGASADAGYAFDRAETERILSGLGQRKFLMNNVHDDHPVVFQTRWALSYLSGPLTRSQIAALMADRKAAVAASPAPTLPAAASPESSHEEPLIPPDVDVVHVVPTRRVPEGAGILYRPAVLGRAKLHFVESKTGLDFWRTTQRIGQVDDESPADPWADSDAIAADAMQFESEGAAGARYAQLPIELTRPRSYTAWNKLLKDFLYREEKLTRFRSASLKQTSKPGETEGDFRARLALPLREGRDRALEEIRRKYAAKHAALDEKLRRAQQRKSAEENQAWSAKVSAFTSALTTGVGAFLGRKTISVTNLRKASTSARAVARAAEQHGDVGRAEENIDAIEDQIKDLEQQMAEDLDAAALAASLENLAVESYDIQPRKADIMIDQVALVWLPCLISPTGAEPAWNS